VTFDEFQRETRRTYHPNRLKHILGLCGEAGEAAELIKKEEFHGVVMAAGKMAEELGDVLWYLAAVASDHGLDLSKIAQQNIEKLKARYPDGFVTGGGRREPVE